MADNKLIINAAVTGIKFSKHDNINLPVSVKEIVDDVKLCIGAGASIVHIHARDEGGEPTYKKEVYAEIIGGIKSFDKDVVLCVSTSGRKFHAFEERVDVLKLGGDIKPDMGTLTLGSFNFSDGVSVNEPEMIKGLARVMGDCGIMAELEVFESGMIGYGKYLMEKGYLPKKNWCNLFLGFRGAIEATAENLAMLVRQLPEGMIWGATGVGRYQHFITSLAVVMGGHVRIGLEDNIYWDYGSRELATNVRLIERVVGMANAYGRDVSTCEETREKLFG